MVATVVVTVATHNLAIGVGVGVLVAMVMFARRVAHFVTVDRSVAEIDGVPVATYRVDGELFFASSNDLYTQFEYALDPERVVIDMHASHLWDASTIAALDAITEKYRHHGKGVDVVGLNDASLLMRQRLGGKLGAGHRLRSAQLPLPGPGNVRSAAQIHRIPGLPPRSNWAGTQPVRVAGGRATLGKMTQTWDPGQGGVLELPSGRLDPRPGDAHAVSRRAAAGVWPLPAGKSPGPGAVGFPVGPLAGFSPAGRRRRHPGRAHGGLAPSRDGAG